MAPLSILTLLGLAASVLALPHTGHFSLHSSGALPSPSGTGVRSRYVPSGTRASSELKSHSHMASHSLVKPSETVGSTIAAKYDAVSSDVETCSSTVTTKIQVTVTITADESTSSTATIAASTSAALMVSSAVVSASSPAAASDTVSATSLTASLVNHLVLPSSRPESMHHSHMDHSSVLSSSLSSLSSMVIASVDTTSKTYASTAISTAATSTATSTTAAAIATSTAIASRVTSTTAATTSASSQGKRGLAYNTASLATPFIGSQKISWAYNWGSSAGGLSNDFTYIPTLWGTSSTFTGSWVANAGAAIEAGSTHLFSFNEPDLAAQADLTPAAAATAYKSLMSDQFGNKANVKLCAPAVTNGADATNATLIGLEWLKSFLIECADCQVDCVNIHWYGTEASDLKQHVADTIAIAGTKEVWFTEFGLNGSPSSDTVSSFLESVMPYLDAQASIAGYAYFMLSQGVLSIGDALNTAGETYMSYSD